MKRLIPCLIVLAVVLDPSAAAGAAKATTVNKNVAVANVKAVSVDFEVSTAVATAELLKGKKHRILIISAFATTTDPCTFEIAPRVNGLSALTLGLTPAHGDLKFSGALGLTTSAEWGLDLDEQEVFNEGFFLNQPLVVELMIDNFSPDVSTATFDAGLVVRMEKR
jgi:hypothetical protein